MGSDCSVNAGGGWGGGGYRPYKTTAKNVRPLNLFPRKTNSRIHFSAAIYRIYLQLIILVFLFGFYDAPSV